jgi:metallo-beta-lactamase class B
MRVGLFLAILAALFAQQVVEGNLAAQATRPELAASRRLFDSWKAPVEPRRLVGNIYYVGAIGVSSFLITTSAGHFLLDTGFDDTVPAIQRGIEQLGFRMSDIKFLLSSHAHNDHTGGHARMQRLSGATIVASAADARLLETGGNEDFSPFPKELMLYPPVKAGRIIRDGEALKLANVTLTAHLTPGHTKGATSWTMNVDDAGKIRPVIFFSSLSIVGGTRLLREPAYPGIVADYRATLATLKSLPCEIWFAPHGGQFAMAEKFARVDRGETQPNPFIDPTGWKALLATTEKSFLEQLAAETRAAP